MIIFNILVIVFIKILLEKLYIDFVYNYFSYTGFVININNSKYIMGWIISIGVYIILYFFRKRTNLYEIFLILYLIYLLPTIIYFSLTNQNTLFFFAIVTSFLMIYFSTLNYKFIHLNKSFIIKKGKPLLFGISFLLVIIVLIHYFIATGGQIISNFLDVYSFRSMYSESYNSGIFGYLNTWTAKVLVIFLLGVYLAKKNKLMIMLLSSAIIFIFLFSGHKSIFGGLVLIIIFYYLFKVKKRELIILLGFFSFIFFIYISDNFILKSLLIRRFLFIPPQLTFVYYDYFSMHPYALWGNSVLKSFVTYPYGTSIANVIGNYMGHPEENANTGFIAFGYAQYGYIGIIIYTLISMILFRILSILSKKVDKFIFASITFIPIMVLFRSSDLMITLFTHGFLLAIIVLWLYENKRYLIKIGDKKITRI